MRCPPRMVGTCNSVRCLPTSALSRAEVTGCPCCYGVHGVGGVWYPSPSGSRVPRLGQQKRTACHPLICPEIASAPASITSAPFALASRACLPLLHHACAHMLPCPPPPGFPISFRNSRGSEVFRALRLASCRRCSSSRRACRSPSPAACSASVISRSTSWGNVTMFMRYL